MFFVIHEMSKGKDSFWYHAFQIAEKPDLPVFWDDSDFPHLQD